MYYIWSFLPTLYAIYIDFGVSSSVIHVVRFIISWATLNLSTKHIARIKKKDSKIKSFREEFLPKGRFRLAALASSKYLNSQSAIKMELSTQANCTTNFLQSIKLQERSSFFWARGFLKITINQFLSEKKNQPPWLCTLSR